MRKGKVGKVLIALLLSMAILPAQTAMNPQAQDVTSSVVINDFAILDGSGNELSETNPAEYLKTYQLRVSWSAVASGTPFQGGDTMTIALPRNSQVGAWIASDSTLENLLDGNGDIIGQWQIINGAIQITLDTNVDGLTSISAEFLTGGNALKNGTPNGVTQDVTMGDQTKSITFLKSELLPIKAGDYKYASSTSNSKILWVATINNKGSEEITTIPHGTNFSIRTNTYFEDEIIEEGSFTGEINVYGYVHFPVDLDLSNGGAASGQSYSFEITSFFTTVTQNATESYDEFKNRLLPLQGGVYRQEGENDKIVINFGDIGNNGMKYTDVNPNFATSAASAAISRGYYPEEARQDLIDYFNLAYGDANVIGGNIVRYAVFFYANYDYVLVDTVKNNVAQLTMDGETKSLAASATLQGNLSQIAVSQNTAAVFLVDEDTGELLTGGSFRLEYNNNGVWETVDSQGILTTNDMGYAMTGILVQGTYRFVETAPSSDEYDLENSQGYDPTLQTVVSEEFEIDPSNLEGVSVIVFNRKYRFDVIYNKGDHGLFADDEHLDVIINERTPGFTLDLLAEDGYEFIGWSPEVSDTVTQDIIYVAQWRKKKVKVPEFLIPNTGVK